MPLSSWKWWGENKQGFTLIETIIALGLFVLLQLTLNQMVIAGSHYYHQLASGRLDDWGGFVLQVQRETRVGHLIKSSARTFTFQMPNGEDVTYEFYQNAQSGMVRRRVDYTGHQPVLMGVEQCLFHPEGEQALTVSCVFDNDLQQQFTFHFANKEETP
ncbi:MAG: competence type IV pilus minor pilin ComGF [Aerococcus sp.]|nr:competence type IV pilus minor pilin ComGF [Aerococcus sp.]